MGITLLMAESNFSNASLVADRVYVLDRGEVLYEGKPKDAMNDPRVKKVLQGSEAWKRLYIGGYVFLVYAFDA